MSVRVVLLGVGLLGAIFAIGCRRSSTSHWSTTETTYPTPTFPDSSEVASIRIAPQVSLKSGVMPEGPLTKLEQIAEVLDWLRGIHWSGRPTYNIRTADLPPVSQLILTMKNGERLTFGFFERGIIFGDWAWSADTDQLKAIFRKAGA